MATRTEQLAQDLPISGFAAQSEVAAQSGGKLGAQLKPVPRADRPRDPNTAVNEDQHELLADVQEVWNQVEQQGGIIPATMLYMHPWRMTATGPHCMGIEIPPCPVEDEYMQFVQRSCRFDFGDRWGKFKVRPVWPIEIMRDFQRQHFSWQGGERPFGGVVVYMGDRLPGSAKQKAATLFDRLQSVVKRVSELTLRKQLEEAIEAERQLQHEHEEQEISDAEILRLIKTAKEQQTAAYERSFEFAEQRHAEKTKIGFNSITNNHRMIARWLFHRRRIVKLPSWVTETKPLDFVQQTCSKCGSDIDGTKGYACVKCGRVYNGIRSYQDGNRDENTMLALKRYKREELEAAGLSAFVEKTLAEEIADDANGDAVFNDDGEAKDETTGKKGKGKQQKPAND